MEYAKEGLKADGDNPLEAVLVVWACIVPVREHRASDVWAYSVPVRNTGPRVHDSIPNSRFLASCQHRSLAKNRKKLLYLRPKGQVALSCVCLTRDAILP